MEGRKKNSGEKRPRVIKITEAVKLLRAAGFEMIEGRKGKHEIWVHPSGIETTLSRGSGQSLSTGYTKQIFDAIDESKNR